MLELVGHNLFVKGVKGSLIRLRDISVFMVEGRHSSGSFHVQVLLVNGEKVELSPSFETQQDAAAAIAQLADTLGAQTKRE